jgi:hypothetical protein
MAMNKMLGLVSPEAAVSKVKTVSRIVAKQVRMMLGFSVSGMALFRLFVVTRCRDFRL